MIRRSSTSGCPDNRTDSFSRTIVISTNRFRNRSAALSTTAGLRRSLHDSLFQMDSQVPIQAADSTPIEFRPVRGVTISISRTFIRRQPSTRQMMWRILSFLRVKLPNGRGIMLVGRAGRRCTNGTLKPTTPRKRSSEEEQSCQERASRARRLQMDRRRTGFPSGSPSGNASGNIAVPRLPGCHCSLDS